MTSIDGALRSSLELFRANLALEIAKEIAPDATAPDGYAASNRSSQSLAQTLAGLRLPATNPDPADQAMIQSLLKNIVTANPTTVQTSLSNMMAAAMAQTPGTLPSDVASQQGFAKEDAAQLTATSVAVNRLQKDGEMAPSKQVAGGGSRSELWEGRKDPQRNEQALSIAKHEVVDNLQNAMLTTGPAQAEHTGIIASFILNAAMLPGWPVPSQASMAEFVAQTKISEEEMLKQLANMGASSELIEKLKKKKRVGKKLLVYLAMLLTAVETVIGTVADELALLSGEEKSLKETRERANSRGHTGARQHVYVE